MTVYIQYTQYRLFMPRVFIFYCIFCLYFDKVHHPGNSVHKCGCFLVQTSPIVYVITDVKISRQLKVGTVKLACAYSSTYLNTCVKTCVYWEQTCGSPVDYIWLVFNSTHTRNNTPHLQHANAAVHHFYSTPDTWSQLLSGFFKGWP